MPHSVSFYPVVPYVPEGFNDKRTLRSEITGESYHIGTTDYAVTRIAECGGLDAYLLNTPEEEIDSQFGVELKRLLHLLHDNHLQFQILECDKVIEAPVSVDETLKETLKLEALLGFQISETQDMVHDVLVDKGIDPEMDDLLGDEEDFFED
eukprot:sb/3473383/